jgi:uncharacterized phage protein gp47/JayE
MAFSSKLSIIATGKYLDKMAMYWGFKRRIYFWIFKESDRALRERMVKHIKNVQTVGQSQGGRT